MTGNGLTKYEGTEPPKPLPGWSAATLFVRGVPGQRSRASYGSVCGVAASNVDAISW
jgi:hypothetical protein